MRSCGAAWTMWAHSPESLLQSHLQVAKQNSKRTWKLAEKWNDLEVCRGHVARMSRTQSEANTGISTDASMGRVVLPQPARYVSPQTLDDFLKRSKTLEDVWAHLELTRLSFLPSSRIWTEKVTLNWFARKSDTFFTFFSENSTHKTMTYMV